PWAGPPAPPPPPPPPPPPAAPPAAAAATATAAPVGGSTAGPGTALDGSLLVAGRRERVVHRQGVGAVGRERGVVTLRDGPGVRRGHLVARYLPQLVETAVPQVDRQRGVADRVHLRLAQAECVLTERAERVSLGRREVISRAGRNDHVRVGRELVGARIRVAVDVRQVLGQVQGISRIQ